MTKKQSIDYLKDLWNEVYNEDSDGYNYAEAIDMAIEALQAEAAQGEWIEEGEYAECSMCGAHSGTQFDGVEPIPLKTNYCPNCGAKMKGGVE